MGEYLKISALREKVSPKFDAFILLGDATCLYVLFDSNIPFIVECGGRGYIYIYCLIRGLTIKKLDVKLFSR